MAEELYSVVSIDNKEYNINAKTAETAKEADKVANSLNIQVGSSTTTFDGSEAKTVTIDIPTTLKNPASLTIKGDGTTTATYDGSTAKTLNIKGSGATTVTADDKGNITISSTGGGQGDLSDYATKEYVDNAIDILEEVIPTRTGQLTNDSGYLTSIPVTMDSGDTYTTITISKNEPSNGYTGDIWFKY